MTTTGHLVAEMKKLRAERDEAVEKARLAGIWMLKYKNQIDFIKQCILHDVGNVSPDLANNLIRGINNWKP